ncbi:hypothetical protein I79_014340 [Cricetulus griseus]|uniref:Uncharacterized protein n=1 Tax=Cricetulus griseus TaxID=10029 RepID=G3HTW1_CRIGR|nr:hypothetical protein I79_014340 [Cricetulus griseus]
MTSVNEPPHLGMFLYFYGLYYIYRGRSIMPVIWHACGGQKTTCGNCSSSHHNGF